LRPINIYLGYDPREAVAYHVCANSIIRHASIPVSITPLALNTLERIYLEGHTDASNTFGYTRFLVPYLNGYTGQAIFMDGDMLVSEDILELIGYLDTKPVAVVKHDYQTKHPVKYLGARNDSYPMKNWSSVVLWNCGHPKHKVLTPQFVQSQPGSYLHRFKWLDESEIGEIPKTWNHLVGEYDYNENAKLAHFTLGVPAFEAYRDCDNSGQWWREFHRVANVE
jgi:hypothetical protein